MLPCLSLTSMGNAAQVSEIPDLISVSLSAAAPIAGTATMMCESNHSEFVAMDIIDNAVRKSPQWKASPAVPPGRSNQRVITQKGQGPLELQNKRQRNLSAGFPSIVDCTFVKLTVGFCTNRRGHLIAARARAMDSDAGIKVDRPLSISSIRRSTSVAQALSMS